MTAHSSLLPGHYASTRTPDGAGRGVLADEPVKEMTMDEWTDAQLIRQWWHIYRQVLARPAAQTRWHTELHSLTAECERRVIVREGQPMPRTGADDLARECDLARGMR